MQIVCECGCVYDGPKCPGCGTREDGGYAPRSWRDSIDEIDRRNADTLRNYDPDREER